MSKVEERALEICPPMIVKDEDGSLDDLTYMARTWVQKGYEAAQKDLGWISVKERLPEELEWVFVCVDMQGRPQCVDLAYRNHGEWCDDENDPGFSVDYWMPIPELPKEK